MDTSACNCDAVFGKAHHRALCLCATMSTMSELIEAKLLPIVSDDRGCGLDYGKRVAPPTMMICMASDDGAYEYNDGYYR